MMGPQNQTSIFSLPSWPGQGVSQLPPLEPGINPDAVGGQPMPAQPYTWAAGGLRLTPEQLELRQKQALANQQVDYSPIQSPFQGLARVAGNVMGALDQRDLDKQSALIQGDRAKSVTDLLAASSGGTGDGAGSTNAVAAALLSTDPAVQKLGMDVYDRLHPKPVNNDTVQDYDFRAQTLGKDAADEWLRRGNDPFISVTTPAGLYAGPQSGLGPALAGVGATGAPQPVQQPQANIPMGNPLDPNLGRQGPVSKTIGGKTYYQIGGDWYDNLEGR